MTTQLIFCEGHQKNGIKHAIGSGQAGKTYRVLGMRLCGRCESVAAEYIRSRGRQLLDMETPMQSADLVCMYSKAIEKCITAQKVNAILLSLGSDGRASKTAADVVQIVAKAKLKALAKEHTHAK